MIITRTPFRISFFGGGTDYPAWYRENGGAVLSTTINKYCYVTCRHLPPFFEHKHRIVYSLIEITKQNADIKHPAVRAIFEYLNVQEGLEVHYDGDLPARSGIGSSSSFAVGLINALLTLRGSLKSKMEMANMAIHVEQNILKETVGSQDQVAAAFGGFNRIDFHRDGTYSLSPVILPRNRELELNSNLMLFFTGFSRYSHLIAKSKVESFEKRKNHLRRMYAMVDEAQAIIQDPTRSLDDFGHLMRESWELKRELSDQVSTTQIDSIIEKATHAGALGGKVLGAGGGGFVLFYVPAEHQESVRTALKDLLEVEFQFEHKGTQLLFYDPDTAIYRSGRAAQLANPLAVNQLPV
jgi:D-glycero-alpha-D-manno-heptose-7-phosphate kinase